MKQIFSMTTFPLAAGGDRYEWKAAETTFAIEQTGTYIIKISAAAKNRVQNNGGDDDDLRVALNGYEFGKYEQHENKISWQGFGTASSWDGTSLQGASKDIFFFVQLQSGEQTIKFFADGTPQLLKIYVYQLKSGETVELNNLLPDKPIQSERNGIPWVSCVFLGVKPHTIIIAAHCQTATKKKPDGDNVKVVLNGRIVQNPYAPTSKKYKNFYFSGDLAQGKRQQLEISKEKFDFIEDSVELWYDQNPMASIQVALYDSLEDWLDDGIAEHVIKKTYEGLLWSFIHAFSVLRLKNSAVFLKKALQMDSHPVVFGHDSAMAKKIKSDDAYKKILLLLRDQIQNGVFSGQIMLGANEKSTIGFSKLDLQYSLHGIKKLDFHAVKRSEDVFDLEIRLFDVYDFEPANFSLKPSKQIGDIANKLENAGRLSNFEIEIAIHDSLNLQNE